MYYSVSFARYPLEYSSCGMLISLDHFLHPSRILDTYVLILVQEGALSIMMGGQSYTVQPGQFIILFPHLPHHGIQRSEGKLSYYWMHFYITDPEVQILESDRFPLIDSAAFPETGTGVQTAGTMQRPDDYTDSGAPDRREADSDAYYVLPAFGSLSDDRKPYLVFQSLLDMTKRDHYAVSWRCHYLASYLVLEIVRAAGGEEKPLEKNYSANLLPVLEYIRVHYADDISTRTIAEEFGFHPVYLERLFRKDTGSSITEYINQTRMEASRNLLVNSIRSLDSIASACGFHDVKYYMRVFRKLSGMTPTQYRKAFSQRKVNTR